MREPRSLRLSKSSLRGSEGRTPPICIPNPATCAVELEALRSKVSLHVSPGRAAGVSKYKGCARPARRTPIFASRENVFWRKRPPLADFFDTETQALWSLRPLKNPWFWKEPRFLRPSDARNAHEKCCGIRLWGSAPNPGRGMIPLHPALCQQPEALWSLHFCVFD